MLTLGMVLPPLTILGLPWDHVPFSGTHILTPRHTLGPVSAALTQRETSQSYETWHGTSTTFA